MQELLKPEVISPIVAVIASLAGGAITFFLKWLKTKVKNIDLTAIQDAMNKARDIIAEAEAKTNFSGQEKFDWVYAQLVMYLKEKGMEIATEQIKAIIQGIIDGHNKILVAGGKKEPTETPEVQAPSEQKQVIISKKELKQINTKQDKNTEVYGYQIKTAEAFDDGKQIRIIFKNGYETIISNPAYIETKQPEIKRIETTTKLNGYKYVG